MSLPLPPELAHDVVVALMKTVAAQTAKRGAVEFWQRLLTLDPARRAAATFKRAAERVAGLDEYHGLEPGMLTQLVQATSVVDDEQLQNYWVQLIAAALKDEIDHSELQWAARVLADLVPFDATVLAMTVDPLPRRIRDGSQGDHVRLALRRLEAVAVIELHQAGMGQYTPWENLVEGERFKPGQEAIIETVRVRTRKRQHEDGGITMEERSVTRRWSATPLGRRFAVLIDMKPLPDYGDAGQGTSVDVFAEARSPTQ
jgi:hypothetical protein